MKTMYRQGDVIIVKLDEVPKLGDKVSLDNGRVVLAYGEVTGHSHAIQGNEAELFQIMDSPHAMLKVKRGKTAYLRHEEHATIELKAGNYEIRRQREYTPGAVKYVAD